MLRVLEHPLPDCLVRLYNQILFKCIQAAMLCTLKLIVTTPVKSVLIQSQKLKMLGIINFGALILYTCESLLISKFNQTKCKILHTS